MITILIHTVESIMSFAGEEAIISVAIKTFGTIIANVINVLIQVSFGSPLYSLPLRELAYQNVNQPLTKNRVTWTPDDLKNVEIIPKKKAISKGDVVFSFIWTAIWAIVCFNADHVTGVYRSLDGDGLPLVMPVFNQDILLSYWPIIVTFIVSRGK